MNQKLRILIKSIITFVKKFKRSVNIATLCYVRSNLVCDHHGDKNRIEYKGASGHVEKPDALFQDRRGYYSNCAGKYRHKEGD